jgi:hypothetical protein
VPRAPRRFYALLGVSVGEPPEGDDHFEARDSPVEVGPAPVLDLEIVRCHVGGGVAARELVDQAITQAGGLAGLPLGGCVSRLSGRQLGPRRGFGGCGRSGLGRRRVGARLGIVSRALVGLEARGQPVALGQAAIQAASPASAARQNSPRSASIPAPSVSPQRRARLRRQVVDQPTPSIRRRPPDRGRRPPRAAAR